MSENTVVCLNAMDFFWTWLTIRDKLKRSVLLLGFICVSFQNWCLTFEYALGRVMRITEDDFDAAH